MNIISLCISQPGLSPGVGSPDLTSMLSGNAALGRLGGMDSGLQSSSLAGLDPMAANMASMGMLLQQMMMVLTRLMGNAGGQSAAQGGIADSGAATAVSGSGGASGGASGGGGSSAAGASVGSNSGAAGSVDLAKSFLGNSAISLKGKLQNYTAAGGTGNDCADFVSAILANTQGFKKTSGDASVATFKQDLVKQGWQKVAKAQSKAGDVVIFNGSQHTELVSKDGGAEAIGSNGGATNQTIKTDSLSWGTQEFYHKG